MRAKRSLGLSTGVATWCDLRPLNSGMAGPHASTTGCSTSVTPLTPKNGSGSGCPHEYQGRVSVEVDTVHSCHTKDALLQQQWLSSEACQLAGIGLLLQKAKRRLTFVKVYCAQSSVFLSQRHLKPILHGQKFIHMYIVSPSTIHKVADMRACLTASPLCSPITTWTTYLYRGQLCSAGKAMLLEWVISCTQSRLPGCITHL